MNRNIDLVHDAIVNVSDDGLDDLELLEEFAAGVEHILREDVLLAVDPEVREALLRRVKYLGQVAQRAFFVEYLVRLRELLAILARSAQSLEPFAETLDLIEETLACALSIL